MRRSLSPTDPTRSNADLPPSPTDLAALATHAVQADVRAICAVDDDGKGWRGWTEGARADRGRTCPHVIMAHLASVSPATHSSYPPPSSLPRRSALVSPPLPRTAGDRTSREHSLMQRKGGVGSCNVCSSSTTPSSFEQLSQRSSLKRALNLPSTSARDVTRPWA